jgi:lysophospholipase L1-like esterase
MKFKKILALAITATMLMPNAVMAADGKTTVYIAGDSTACEYGTDDNYALPRAGWGMYLDEFLDDGVEVKDLAKSGRSSKSLTTEDEYKLIFDNIKEGDYLFVQFGHNDAKNSSDEDKELRYTDPEGDKDTEGSFKNSLYVNYIKPAQEKGARVVLLTPISRRKFGEDGKVTDSHGLYDDDVRELADELNLPCIDLTEETAELYNAVGEETAKLYHAIFKDATKGEDGFDNTHLNHYGAEKVAALVADALLDVDADGLGKDVQGLSSVLNNSDNITRGEYTAKVVRLLGIEAETEDSFADVKADDVNYNAIAVAKKVGIVSGTKDGTFKPDDKITAQDIAVITAKALEYVNALKIDTGKTTYKDACSYAAPALNALAEAGIVSEDLTAPTNAANGFTASQVLAKAYEAKTNADKISSGGEMSLDELEKVE